MTEFEKMFIDKRVKGKKCEKCYYVLEAYKEVPDYPCSMCINRPTRRNDKDEFIEAFDAELDVAEKKELAKTEKVDY